MNAAEREQPPSSARTADPCALARFARLNDLLAPIRARQARDQLRGRRAAASGSALYRPGDGAGISPNSTAIPPTRAPSGSAKPSPAGCARRFDLPRPLDPEAEVLVLNGTREGLFLAALAASRNAAPKRRAGRPSWCPIPAMAPIPPALRPRIARRSICRPPRRPDFLPDLDAIDAALLARTVAFYIASPANPQGSVASCRLSAQPDRARAPARLRGVFRRVLFGNLFRRETGRHARSRRPRLRQCDRVQLAVEAIEPAGPARRLLRRRPAISWRAFSNIATIPRRRCRCPTRKWRRPRSTTRRM